MHITNANVALALAPTREINAPKLGMYAANIAVNDTYLI